MNLDGYVPVDARLRMALNKYPNLRVVEEGYRVVGLGDRTFLECVVWVYPTPDDERPVRGCVLEPWPGKTSFTRDSEAAVGFTSALGRALGYLGFGIERGIASVDEIRARTEDPDLEVTVTKASKVGSLAKKAAQIAAQAPQEVPPVPEDPEPAKAPQGRRQLPTEKMMGFLQKLNRERGNPLSDQDVARCAADFDECRRRIDELQALPKD